MCNSLDTHKEELLDFKLNQHFICFQTEQFRKTVVTHRWKDNNSLDIRLYLESRPGICCAFRLYINYFGSINSFLSCQDKKIIKSTKSQVRNIFQNICPIIKNKIQSTEGRLKCAECHPWRGEAGGEVQSSSQSI